MPPSPLPRSGRLRRWQHARDLLSVLIGRDLKILYKRSALGFGWALATPLIQLFIFSFIFRRALSLQIENYASFVFIGVLVLGWFQSSISQSGGLITGSKAFVTQPGFPLTLLPHVTVAVRLFHFVIAMPLLFGLLWWQGIRPAWSWVSLPALLFVQYLLIVGIAYPMASINVIFRDTQHLVSVLLQLLIYVTPVFYSLDLVPASLRPWFYVNPMVGLVQSWRAVLLDGAWPDVRVLAGLLAAGTVFLIAGRRTFQSQSHRFAEEM